MSETALPLVGHGQAQEEFLKALDSGRLHHAWLVEGPSGIGKARFVLRLASLLLDAEPVDDDPAGARQDDPVIQKILADGHPDLKQVRREVNDKGVLKQDISVDQIRDLNGFFSLKPALGGWRIGIIDALDEMNESGLNALLKTLEEPPAKALLFLISHATRPILPTIRSRCQTLRLKSLSEEDTRRVLALQSDEYGAEIAALVKGRPGRAAELSGPKVVAAANAARTLLRAMPSANEAQLAQAVATASDGDEAFKAFSDSLLDWLAGKAESDPSWSEVWFESQQIIAGQQSLHLPPAQASAKLIACLQTGFANR